MKLCGGRGSRRPGPCPKGRAEAHKVMRAHATAAQAQAAKTGQQQAKAQASHAKHAPGTKGEGKASARLQQKQQAHAKTQGKAERLHRKAAALEHQHGVQQRAKAGAKAKRQAGKKPAEKPTSASSKREASAPSEQVLSAVARVVKDAGGDVSPERGKALDPEKLRQAAELFVPGGIGKKEFGRALKQLGAEGMAVPDAKPEEKKPAPEPKPASKPAPAPDAKSKPGKISKPAKTPAPAAPDKPAETPATKLQASIQTAYGKLKELIQYEGKPIPLRDLYQQTIADHGKVMNRADFDAQAHQLQAAGGLGGTEGASAPKPAEKTPQQAQRIHAADLSAPQLHAGIAGAVDAASQAGQDDLVSLKDAYHNAEHRMPGLTVPQFHAALQTMWDNKQLSLQTANDPKGLDRTHVIKRGDNNFAYVILNKQGKELAKQRATQHADRFAEQTYSLKNVALFQIGNPRGKRYTRQDADDIVRNYSHFSAPRRKCKGGKCVYRPPVVVSPAVLGHEEEQKFMERTDQPAAGWISRLWHDGKTLFGDISGIARVYADAIRSGAYKTVSAEIYPQLPHGCPESRAAILRLLKQDKGIFPDAALPWARKHARAEQSRQKQEHAAGKRDYVEDLSYLVDAYLRAPLGRALRRIGYLGAQVPEIKTISELPQPEEEKHTFAFSEKTSLRFRAFKRRSGREMVFSESVGSEGKAMSREEMLKALSERGVDCSLITDAIPDPLLAEWLRSVDDSGEESDDDDAEGSDESYDDDEDRPDEMDDSDEDDEDKKKLDEMSDEDDEEDEDKKGLPMKPASMNCSSKYAERRKQIRHLVSTEIARGIKALRKEAQTTRTEAEKFAEERRAAERAIDKKGTVEKFCEAKLKEGKLLPRDLDRANVANVFDRLMRADSRVVVQKYAEKDGKEIELTEFDLQLREIDSKVPMQFGERFRDPAEALSKEEGEARKVEQHYDQYAERFTAVEVTKENLLKAFKARQAKDKSLTAEKFLTSTK